MSKKKRKSFDYTYLLHQVLRTPCQCTEQEIDLIDHVLQQLVPNEDAAQMQAIYEGKVQPKPRGKLLVDMENGELMEISLTNHPTIILNDYLTDKYGKRFGTLYWLALGCTPQKFYHQLRGMCKAPFFADILAEVEVGQ